MKRANDIVQSFLEETNIKKNEKVLMAMAYGSRIAHNSRKNSDLDILVVIDSDCGYRAAMMIDGVHLDISIMTLDGIIKDINLGRANGNMYTDSVLTTGRLLYDNNIYKSLVSKLDEKIEIKRKINPIFVSVTLELLEKYLASDNDDFYYYNAMDFIRQLVDVKFNNSIIKANKVYCLYTDRKRAEEDYKIKIPPVTFVDNYLNALREKDAVKRKKVLLELFNLVKDDIEGVPFHNRSKDLDIDEIKLELVTLNNLVCYVEDLILNDHPYSIPLYFIAIHDLDRFIRDALEVLPTNYEYLVKKAKLADDQESRIRALEDLFMIVDSKYKMDYDNFCIKRYSYKTINV